MFEVYIKVDKQLTDRKLNIPKNLTTKDCIEISKILLEMSDEIIEQGIKNDVKKFYKKEVEK